MSSHKKKQKLQCPDCLEKSLEQSSGLLDDIGVWLLQLDQDIGKALLVDVVQDAVVNFNGLGGAVWCR